MKAIFFDFDGTLTYKTKNIWRRIWEELGYETDAGSYYRSLFTRFSNGEISHQEWCDLTAQAFIQRGLKRETVERLASEIRFIKDFEKTVKVLHDKGYKLFVLSGNVTDVIASSLGENVKYFEKVLANKFEYDHAGYLSYIIGTKYDFEGKGEFIKKFIKETNSKPEEIFFVGNGDNDEWAYKSGCYTICVNPEHTDHKNRKIWRKSIPYMDSLLEIVPVIEKQSLKIKDDSQM